MISGSLGRQAHKSAQEPCRVGAGGVRTLRVWREHNRQEAGLQHIHMPTTHAHMPTYACTYTCTLHMPTYACMYTCTVAHYTTCMNAPPHHLTPPDPDPLPSPTPVQPRLPIQPCVQPGQQGSPAVRGRAEGHRHLVLVKWHTVLKAQ